ncbi:MAG: hypothetical protein RMK84_02930 [Oscillochloridaceae bacterium]|nr:hypothetical protein [Chloroflexaceae bacterium]MDW8389056.1 hypothetical protein [Oscillochloridaceae bacterium]
MFEFIRAMWVGTIEAMRLNPRAFEIVEANPRTGWVVLAVAIVGGASLLLGQSVILFVNRVRPGRFVLSLLLNGVVFALSLMVWGAAIWLTSKALFPNEIPLSKALRLTAMGAAPYVFGFLVLLPYAGNFIGKVLAVWSFLVVLAAMTSLANGNFGPALVCTVIGWLLVMVMSATIGRPVIYARNAIYRRITGADLDASVQDILTQFAAPPEEASSKSRKGAP